MNDAKTILNRAADLLEKPGAWTQDGYARDADGNKLRHVPKDAFSRRDWYVDSDNAEFTPAKPVCFCAAGALMEALDYDYVTISYTSSFRSLQREVEGNVFAWNDAQNRTQDEVVSTLRKAANSCQ